jgi:hypothetical protein
VRRGARDVAGQQGRDHRHDRHGRERRGVDRAHAEEQPGEHAAERQGRHQADRHAGDRQNHPLLEDEREDVLPARAERHPDPDLPPALLDHGGDDPVDPDRCEDESDRREEARASCGTAARRRI